MKTVLLLFTLLFPAMTLSSALSQSTHSAAISSRWLLSYKGKTSWDVATDMRLQALLRRELPHYAVGWGEPLPKAINRWLGNYPGTAVTVESDRFVTIKQAFPTEGDTGGLLWCDTAPEQSEMIFAILWHNTGPTSTKHASLDIYTNRKETHSSLPPSFITDILSLEKDMGVTSTTIITIAVHDAQNNTASLPSSTFENSTR
ncbi:MAG: hypothetical protein ABSE27_08570 [Acidobacteriaceae bacterium]|jgi:hypothetical protein